MKKLVLMLFVCPLLAMGGENVGLIAKNQLLVKYNAAGHIQSALVDNQPTAQSSMDTQARRLTLKERLEAFQKRAQTESTRERECVECFTLRPSRPTGCATDGILGAGLIAVVMPLYCASNPPVAIGLGVTGAVLCTCGVCVGAAANRIIDGPLYDESGTLLKDAIKR